MTSPLRWPLLLSPLAPPPVPLDELSHDDATLVINHIPRLRTTQSLHWLKEPAAMWRAAVVDPVTPRGDPLLDDSFRTDRADLDKAVWEMSKGLSGVFATPSPDDVHVWFFSAPAWAPLMWAVFALIADRGNENRVQHAVAAGLPEATLHSARAVVLRVQQLVERALALGDHGAPDALDATLTKPYSVRTVLFPLPGQVVELRPAAAKALASVLLSSNIWSGDTIDRAPLSMLNALTMLSHYDYGTAYKCNIREIEARLTAQEQCKLGPGRAYDMDKRTALMLALTRQMNVTGDRNFRTAVFARALVWNDPAARRFMEAHAAESWTSALWRVAAAVDQLTSVCTSETGRFSLPPITTADLEARVGLMLERFGKHIPIEILLTCMPFTPKPVTMEHTLVGSVSPSEVWRRIVPLSGTTVMPHTVSLEHAETIQQLSHESQVGLSLLQQSAATRLHAAVVYELSPRALEEFSGMLAATRLLAASVYGDRVWNLPGNIVLTDSAAIIEATTARALMLRTMMLRLYGVPDIVAYFPFVTPLIARELCTLHEIPDMAMRTEIAACLCDFIATMMCPTSAPRVGISRGGVMMTDEALHIRLPGPDVSWPIAVCTRFLPAFLGNVTHHRFGRRFRTESPLLYNGYLNTVVGMMRALGDPHCGEWRWPRPVMDIILRYFFLVHMQLIGLIPREGDLPEIYQINRPMIQILAFMYMHHVLIMEDVCNILELSAENSSAHSGGKIVTLSQVMAQGRRAAAGDPDRRQRCVHVSKYRRAPKNALELGTLALFPVHVAGTSRQATVSDELAQLTDAFTDLSRLPRSYPASEYASFQSRSKGSRDSVRCILRAVRHIFETNATVLDLARGIAESAAATDETAVPRAPRKKQPASKKKAKPSDFSSDEEPILAEVPKDSIMREAIPIANDEFGSSATHVSINRKRYKKDPTEVALAAAVGIPDGDDNSSEFIDYDAQDYEDDDDNNYIRECKSKQRRAVLDATRAMGFALSRFVVMAISIAGAEPTLLGDQELPNALVRVILGTSMMSYGQGCKGLSWEHSPRGGHNRVNAVHSTVMDAFHAAYTTAVPYIYEPRPDPMRSKTAAPLLKTTVTSGFTADSLRSLFDLEIAPFAPRVAILAEPRFETMWNCLPGDQSIEDMRDWDFPVASTYTRHDGEKTPMWYPYSPQIGVDPNRVRDVPSPITEIPPGNRDRTREELEREVPYDFRFSLWLWRAMPLANTPYGPDIGIGVDAVVEFGGALASVLRADRT